eukprot:scaffold149714_cov37-Tisochrysis_lutea.AAC.4
MPHAPHPPMPAIRLLMRYHEVDPLPPRRRRLDVDVTRRHRRWCLSRSYGQSARAERIPLR